MKPKISIITVVYNGAQVIEPTLQSILGQTFHDYEYIIIDGASKDNTLQVIQKYRDRIHQVVSEPDRGVYDAMNKGMALATGEYILFMNAGDELAHPTILQTIFEQLPLADLYYGETIILSPDRQLLGTRTQLTSRKLPATLTKKDFLQGQVVSHQSFIPRKSLCRPYQLQYSCSADIDWMLHILDQKPSIQNVGEPISRYLQGGISDRKLWRCWRERFWILVRYFNLPRVIWAHLGFLFRFIRYRRYGG